ncbi:MAG: class SAM-dependent methyltransferase [Nevskia sp.]|nr:class SAM-dependent methyltransferase [Nevskia sp.]
MTCDPYSALKSARQKEWARGSERDFTTPTALRLIEYVGVRMREDLLDVGCGSGAVAIAAQRAGARVCGLESSIAQLEVARWRAATIGATIDFRKGSAEALPFGGDYFDVVISELGQMFAPHPGVVVREMVRVLKPGGRIAFSAWPQEALMGQILALADRHLPHQESLGSYFAWGSPQEVRDRLAGTVVNVEFEPDEISILTPSLQHYCSNIEFTMEPVKKVVLTLAHDPVRLAQFRRQLETVVANWHSQNRVRLSYTLARGIKR